MIDTRKKKKDIDPPKESHTKKNHFPGCGAHKAAALFIAPPPEKRFRKSMFSVLGEKYIKKKSMDITLMKRYGLRERPIVEILNDYHRLEMKKNCFPFWKKFLMPLKYWNLCEELHFLRICMPFIRAELKKSEDMVNK